MALRLAYRRPFAAPAALAFLGRRAIPGVEQYDAGTYRRSLDLPHGAGTVELRDGRDHVAAVLRLSDTRDLTAAVSRTRRLLDLDADAPAIDGFLGSDAALRPLVARCPGRRVVGAVSGGEMAVRAVLGQQISVTAARTLAGRLTARYGKPLMAPAHGITHQFPDMAALADADPGSFGMPRRRAGTIIAVATAVADGTLTLDPGADPVTARNALLAIPGIGDWTADYVAMRALRDPDAIPVTDLGLRKAATALGIDAGALAAHAQRWRPWRAYAAEHLWASLEAA